MIYEGLTQQRIELTLELRASICYHLGTCPELAQHLGAKCGGSVACLFGREGNQDQMLREVFDAHSQVGVTVYGFREWPAQVKPPAVE
jgi:xanthine/CO dehydrogenase XdhC/CoxF family maturation factor